MCNISEKTGLESVTVYKVVVKDLGRCFGYFSGVRVVPGPAQKQDSWVADRWRRFSVGNRWYNEIMAQGMCSGMADLADAIQLMKNLYTNPSPRIDIVSVVLRSGEGRPICSGSGRTLGRGLDDAIIYAGPVIESVKEVTADVEMLKNKI